MISFLRCPKCGSINRADNLKCCAGACPHWFVKLDKIAATPAEEERTVGAVKKQRRIKPMKRKKKRS